MNLTKLFFLSLLGILASCAPGQKLLTYQSEGLEIRALTPKVFSHITYLQTNDWGKVACNGMIYCNHGEAVVFDTPTNDSVSTLLISWIESNLKAKVTAVVVNHFHNDCLGGLKAFHQRGIPSYSNRLTITLAQAAGTVVPQNGFEDFQVLDIGGKKVENRFLGEGHTKDNIVSYVPSERIMFGGCMIKALNATKGFLGDANVEAWPQTVAKVKAQYPGLKLVIPGHGDWGGVELLDYTRELFKSADH